MQPSTQPEPTESTRKLEAARNILLRIASVLIGFAMILLGAVLTLFALPALLEWEALQGGLKLTIVVWTLSGPLILACGLWLLVSLGRSGLPVWIGSAALLPSGALMVIGVLTHFIPCAGPT